MRETYRHIVKQAVTSKLEDQMCPAHHAADVQNKQDMEKDKNKRKGQEIHQAEQYKIALF